uniref:Uncharacterized protein n=1 Tax=Arundo donax TaxID=35708 RepID=A0A0A9A0I4_ARUDO
MMMVGVCRHRAVDLAAPARSKNRRRHMPTAWMETGHCYKGIFRLLGGTTRPSRATQSPKHKTRTRPKVDFGFNIGDRARPSNEPEPDGSGFFRVGSGRVVRAGQPMISE